jgi:hypothetical protein
MVMGQAAHKRFDDADDVRTVDKGRMETVRLAGSTAGRATFEPGWRWSESVKPVVGTDACEAHHVGYALSGTLHVRTSEGEEIDIGPDDAYEILPGHDAWVVGGDAFRALEFQSATAEHYGKAES